MSKRIRVSLTERGEVLVSIVNNFGEHNMVVLTNQETEEFLYDLHSIVMTKRGHDLPSGRIKRFLKRT